MTDSTDDLPDDIERLKAMLLAERSEKALLADQNERCCTCCASFGAITSGGSRSG